MTYETSQLNENEEGKWGIFISHASKDEKIVQMICREMDKKGIRYLYDRQIKLAAENFSDEILKMIKKCVAAIIVITDNFIKSKWCNFEVGVIDGLGKNIYLYDPNHILEGINCRFHYDRFCPVFVNIDALLKAIRVERIFYSIFNHETAQLSKELFEKKVDEELLPVKITMHIPGFNKFDSKMYKMRVLIIHFGNFSDVFQKYKDKCAFSSDPLINQKCEFSGYPCCLQTIPEIDEYPECVLLNHVWDAVVVNEDKIEVMIPLHKKQGTTFKMMIDASSGELAEKMIDFLKQHDLDPSFSKSGTENRIYFSLNTNCTAGVFRKDDLFFNNFICPGILHYNR